MEDELLDIAEKVEIAYFVEAKRDNLPGPYDIALVEGSVSTPHQEELIKKVREDSKYVIAIGACATAGGIQALRNWANVEEFKNIVYPKPEWIEALSKSRPISDYIKVDFEVRGCPVSKSQLLWIINQLLRGKTPTIPTSSVCLECKIKGNPCVVVTKGIPCLGPVTMIGCGALCPSYGRGCYGCFGPMDDPKPETLAKHYISKGINMRDVCLLFKGFTGWTEPFRKVVNRYGC
jgi:coenzyme F420-reducing hydrogenase gamma subunit